MDLRRIFKSKTDGTNFLRNDELFTLCGYSFTQFSAADVWTINHNNDSTIIAVQVYIDNFLVEPDEIIVDNSDSFRILFSEPVAGVVNFLVFKSGSVCNPLTGTPTPSPTSTPPATPGASPTTTVTPTPSVTVTPTITPTNTVTPTVTPTLTVTPTATGVALVRTTGYVSGGAVQPAGGRTLQSYPFASPFTLATAVGQLTNYIFTHAGHSSVDDGYVSGGYNNNTFVELARIERFPFASPFTTGVSVGNLGEENRLHGGTQSSTDGYAVGGDRDRPALPSQQSTVIESFPFAGPFGTATTVGDLNAATEVNAANGSTTDGYSTGGLGLPSTQVERFPFSSPFTNATNVGNLQNRYQDHDGIDDIVGGNGFTAGGYVDSSPSTQIESFPFAAPFVSSVTVGQMSVVRIQRPAGASGVTDGFITGGYNPAGTNVQVDRFPYASPFTSATQVGTIDDLFGFGEVRNCAGHQS